MPVSCVYMTEKNGGPQLCRDSTLYTETTTVHCLAVTVLYSFYYTLIPQYKDTTGRMSL